MTETVLIVDDASSHLRLTEYAIGQKLGYRVVTASSEEAVRWVMTGRQPQPDLILLDLSIPEIDGLKCIRDIKLSRPQLPVVVLVSYGDEHATQVAQMGIDDALSKPVTLERLRFSLRNVLTIRRLKHVIDRLEGRFDSSWDEGNVSVLPNAAVPDTIPAFFDDRGCIKKLKSIEEEIIRLALRHNSGCMTRAARQLGIGRSTLYRRVNDLGIDGYISRANQATRPMMTASSAERS